MTYTKDPLKHCSFYKKYGCSHVDGYLCNVETCIMEVDSIDVTAKDLLKIKNG